MARSAPVVAIAALVLAVAIGGLGLRAGRAVSADLAAPADVPPDAWAGSDTCRTCHPDHHASWARTFHRTMTQEATPATVVGAFDGRVLPWMGVRVRPVRERGRFYFDTLDDSGRVTERVEVRRTVGSRRYQQYLARPGGEAEGNYVRLPLLWHIEEDRWIHLNGAFLDPEGIPYDQHLAIWNQNCIFCHNTGPEPGASNWDEMVARAARGEAVDPARDARYRSEVAELGISCESCHAPGAVHARRNRNPLRRYALALGDWADPTIVDPADLEPRHALDVCGQCHGQRLPDPRGTIRDWLADGPAYRAGDALRDTVEPVFRDTEPPLGAAPDLFRQRFWNDGTPRLTAYEYQGLLQSPCFVSGGLHCIDCHTMHSGDVRGQLPEENRTAAACVDCHPAIAADPAAHSFHSAEGPGSSCTDCHLPRMVYGVMEIHRSHRIENPDPAASAAAARPDACTGCHLDRSLAWAAERSREWWGERYRVPTARADGAPVAVADAVASLHAGDPVQRAVAARLAGRSEAPLDPTARAALVPHLLVALADRYPTIRWLARLSLRDLLDRLEAPGAGADAAAAELAELVEGFDYLADPGERARVLGAAWSAWSRVRRPTAEPPPDPFLLAADWTPRPEVAMLRALQGDKEIHIGE